MKKIILSAVVLACFLCGTANAMRLGFNYLYPTSHGSASGEYELFVDPSHIMGSGPADYRLTQNGGTVWTNRFPFSLWNAAVSDSGLVAGVAYSHGLEGYPVKDFEDRPGDFSVILLSPEGTLIAKDSVPRKGGGCNNFPAPAALDIFFDGDSTHAVVRVDDHNRNLEPWWIYDLASGKRTDILTPGAAMDDRNGSRYILKAKPIPGMPLFLLHWWRYGASKSGAEFTLMDTAGTPIWELSLPEDYMMPDNKEWSDSLRNHIRQSSAILDVGLHGTFDLYHVQDQARVSYGIEQTKSGQWNAQETDRTPYQWTEPTVTSNPPPATTDLKTLGTFRLTTSVREPSNTVSGITAFDFDSEGHICARKGQSTLVLLSQDGQIFKELVLPRGDLSNRYKITGPACVGGSRFILGAGSQGIGGTTHFYRVDFDTETVDLVAQVACSSAKAVAGFPDGRFVALTDHRYRNTMADGLFFFSSDGDLVWQREQDGYRSTPDELLSPDDIIPYGSNAFAILDNIRNSLQLFDDHGEFQQLIDLEEAWGREPNYPTDLAPDQNDGFIVYDFNAKESLLLLNSNGSIRSASSPRYEDGRLFRVFDGVKRSPQGDLWTCNGRGLIRLNTNSVADRILGPSTEASLLSEPGLVRVGPNDRVYVADKQSKTIHVFDSSGSPLGRCTPAPEDLKETSRINHLAFSPKGHLFATIDISTEHYLQFDSDFNRIGWTRIPTDRRFGKDWYFPPTGSNLWIAGMHDLLLVDGASNLIRCISRRVDGQWLERIGLASVAPDGSIAIRASSKTRTSSINIFDAEGQALATFDTPSFSTYSDHYPYSPLVYDGNRIFLRKGHVLSIHDIHGIPTGHFSFAVEEETKKWVGPFLAAEGNELWFIAPEDVTVHRFAVPD